MQKTRSNKLNLGSGRFKKRGFINVDIDKSTFPDVTHDLNKFPYPFKHNQFEVIEADHLLEHLDNPFRTMQEIHRISAPEAKVIIRVPHFSRGFTHADHKRGFDITFPFYFNPTFIGGYQGCHFLLHRIHFRWFAQPYLKKKLISPSIYTIAVIIGTFIDLFANFSPFLCSRIWCFWVGGFEEIEFQFKPQKKP